MYPHDIHVSKEVKGLQRRGGDGWYQGYIKTIEEHSIEKLIYVFQKCQYRKGIVLD